MKALVYRGPGKRSWEAKPEPVMREATDAIVRIANTTICGTDLHIMKGDVPEVPIGLTLGHEGVGIVEKVGSGVSGFRPGDKVLISCITSCGKCTNCKRGMYSHCENGGGWILGHRIDGTQAESVRIPFADTSLHHVPHDVDEAALVMLSDIFPTGFECGVLNGAIKPGDVVAIVGAGPIGLATLLTAKFYSPAVLMMIDTDDNRLRAAMELGATKVFSGKNGVVDEVLKFTSGKGVDVAIEAVGVPATFDICQSIIAPGGHIANVGVHGKSVELRLDKLWSSNITITTRLVDTVTTPMLLKIVQSGKLQPQKLITHRFMLNDIMKAYDTFEHAAREKALKVILSNSD
ncbi:MAG TPA: zinc-dependent alcohol dehydrogenase family protein [Bacteroidota bacterium]|nr:zinc-dependent alcohol dehydrogenase family protein [Bacteroidota bacterium]